MAAGQAAALQWRRLPALLLYGPHCSAAVASPMVPAAVAVEAAGADAVVAPGLRWADGCML